MRVLLNMSNVYKFTKFRIPLLVIFELFPKLRFLKLIKFLIYPLFITSFPKSSNSFNV